MQTKNFGRNTAITTGILAAYGGYNFITGGDLATYDDINAVAKRMMGGIAFMLAFCMFSLRIAIAKVLDKLDEDQEE